MDFLLTFWHVSAQAQASLRHPLQPERSCLSLHCSCMLYLKHKQHAIITMFYGFVLGDGSASWAQAHLNNGWGNQQTSHMNTNTHTWIQTWTNVGTSRVVAWVLWTPPLKLFSQVRGNRWLWWHQPPQKSLRHRRDHPPTASGAASDIQRSMAISLLKCGLTMPLLLSPDTSTAQLVWEFSKSLWSFHYKFCLLMCFYVLTHYHN